MAVCGEAVFFAADIGPAGTLDHGSVSAKVVHAPVAEREPAGEHVPVFLVEIVPFAVVFHPAGEHVPVALVKIVPFPGVSDPAGLIGAVRGLVVGPAVYGGEFSECTDAAGCRGLLGSDISCVLSGQRSGVESGLGGLRRSSGLHGQRGCQCGRRGGQHHCYS